MANLMDQTNFNETSTGLQDAYNRARHNPAEFEEFVKRTNPQAYQQALRVTEALFSGKVQELTLEEIEMGFEGIPSVELTEDTNIIDALVMVKAASSKREAREFIQNGAVLINGVQEKSLEFTISKDNALGGKYTIVRRGKKNYYLLKH